MVVGMRIYVQNIIGYFRLFGVTALLCILFFYFLYHTIYGNRGFFAYFGLKESLIEVTHVLSSSRQEHLDLDHKIELLNPESLDSDMLDEQVRRTLGYAKDMEQIVILSEKNFIH